MWFRVGLVIALLCLTACASRYSVSERQGQAQRLAREADWVAQRLQVPGFDFMAYVPQRWRSGPELTVYIEGDGLAWLTPTRPSSNPTPLNPVGLKLALAHPAGEVAYLGRACQYLGANAAGCDPRYWTEERFSPEVVQAMSTAVSQLKAQRHAQRIILVGYSGGGALAVLLAAQRSDVQRIVTVAGNLDTQAWTQRHGLGELVGSINPADWARRVAHIPQWHFVGAQDSNIVPALVQGYAAQLPPHSPAHVLVLDGFTHSCCWAEGWAALWAQHLK